MYYFCVFDPDCSARKTRLILKAQSLPEIKFYCGRWIFQVWSPALRRTRNLLFSLRKRSNVYVYMLEIGLKEIYGFWMWSFESLIDGPVDVLMSMCENKLVQCSVENVKWNWFCDTSDVEKLLLSTSSST